MPTFRFQLSRTTTRERTLRAIGPVELSGDARGADEYLRLRNRGYQLRGIGEGNAT